MQLNKQQILEIVNRELLLWIRKDATVKDAVINLVNTKYPTKKETDDKFEKLLKELANDREAQSRKWDEQKLEDKKKWDEQNKKWDENQKNINKILDEIKAMNRKHDQSIGAIGARWGIRSEASFRNALKGILEEINSEYNITHYNEHDSEGIVYGEPQDIEIDVIMKNGNIYLIEISSNIKMSDIRIFNDKIKFYEKQHKQKVYKLIIISPWIDEKTRKLAKEKGFKLFSYMEDVKL